MNDILSLCIDFICAIHHPTTEICHGCHLVTFKSLHTLNHPIFLPTHHPVATIVYRVDHMITMNNKNICHDLKAYYSYMEHKIPRIYPHSHHNLPPLCPLHLRFILVSFTLLSSIQLIFLLVIPPFMTQFIILWVFVSCFCGIHHLDMETCHSYHLITYQSLHTQNHLCCLVIKILVTTIASIAGHRYAIIITMICYGL